MRPYLIIMLFFCTSTFGISQKTNVDLDSIILEMGKSLAGIESISFSAIMYTKKFSSDTFKEKKFDVFARKNPNNTGYHYDWEIVEYKAGSEQRYIFVGKEFFYINKIYPTIGYSNNVQKLSPGDYFENMRWNTLFDEFLYSINYLYREKEIEAGIDNQNGNYNLIVKIDSVQDREITLERNSFLPIAAKNIVRHREMNLLQIIETKLSGFKINEYLPDSVLAPQYYLNQNYEFKYIDQETDEKQDSNHFLTDHETRLLFEAVLTSSTGDTTRLKNIPGDLFLIDFWFMSCIPCLKSMPHLQELSEEYKDKKLRIIGINCHDGRDKESVGRKLSEKGITYENYFAEKDLLQKLHIIAFPTILIIGKDRSAKFLGVGLGEDFEIVLKNEIEKLK